MKKFLAILTAALTLIAMPLAHAEVKTYEGKGEYLMTEETMDFAKAQAELQAMSSVIESICVFIKEQSTMIDHELDTDEIIKIAAGILRVIGTAFSVEEDVDGLSVSALVTAQVDTDELEKLLDKEVKARTSNK